MERDKELQKEQISTCENEFFSWGFGKKWSFGHCVSMHNYAFIDSQNVHLGIRDQGWKLDWRRLRVYLSDKYDVHEAFIFIGHVSGNERTYAALQSAGYILVFKPTLIFQRDRQQIVKGNVDAELVLHAMIEWKNYDKAVIISGDGDFHCLIKYLLEKEKLCRLIVPNQRKHSRLLREFSLHTTYLDRLQGKLEYINRKRGISSGQNPSVSLSS